MITKNNCIQTILLKVPEFQKSWEEHIEYWDGESAGLCNDVAEFSRFVKKAITMGNEEMLSRIFYVVEELMSRGDVEVQTATATCFLENIINKASDDTAFSLSFVNLLGEKSREYCIAWDKFTDVQTPGL